MRLVRNGLGFVLKAFPSDWKRRLSTHLGAPDTRWSLMQLRGFGFIPKNAMDVGAFKGYWARVCLDIFPEAKITCIEPQDEPQKYLRKLSKTKANVQVIQILLGRMHSDFVPFQEKGPGSSVLLGSGSSSRSKPMTTIDALIKSGKCEPPELVKLDVQGYEIEILEGWTVGFEHCQVIQSEISLLPIVQGAPLLHELVTYLHRRGFVMFDVDELIRAPSDGAVWQIDALFCQIDSPLRSERVWRSRSSSIMN